MAKNTTYKIFFIYNEGCLDAALKSYFPWWRKFENKYPNFYFEHINASVESSEIDSVQKWIDMCIEPTFLVLDENYNRLHTFLNNAGKSQLEEKLRELNEGLNKKN